MFMLIAGGLGASAEAAESFGDERFFIGDLHVHTGASGDGGSSDITGTCDGGDENCLAVADLHETAKTAGLDFWSITDHINGDNVAPGTVFKSVMDTVMAGHDPSHEYVLIPGGEVWFDLDNSPQGHKTLLMLGEDEDLDGLELSDLQFDGSNKEIGACDDIWRYTESLEERFGNVLLISHHPGLARGMGTNWDCHDSEAASWYSPAVEIYSNHGNSEHHEVDYDPVWAGFEETGTAAAAIDPDQHALRLGFIAGTDSHDTRPGSVCTIDNEHRHHPYGGGLTIVALDEDERFDREAIFQAIQDRRSYASSGPLVPVQVRYLQGGVELGGMGVPLRLDPAQSLEVEVSVPGEWAASVMRVDLVTPHDLDGDGWMSDDDGVWTGSLPAAEFDGYLYPRLTIEGEAWYGREGCDDGGADTLEQVWVSPSYITLVAGGEPEESTGSRVERCSDPGAGDCDDGEVWSNGRPVEGPSVVEARTTSCDGLGGAALSLGPLALLLSLLRRRQDY